MGKIQRIRESKTGKTIVKKGKSGIGRILFGRTGIILLLLLLQLGILFIVFSRLQQHIIYAYWSFVLLSALTAILIINRPGNPAFKLAWMVPITFFPVFGMLQYLVVEFQAGTVWLNHRVLHCCGRKNVEHCAGDSEKEGTGGRGSPVYV